MTKAISVVRRQATHPIVNVFPPKSHNVEHRSHTTLTEVHIEDTHEVHIEQPLVIRSKLPRLD